MNKNELRSIITAGILVNGMDQHTLKQTMLDLLASNPKLITKVLGITKDVKTNDPTMLYKVVLVKRGTNKINFIKLARELHGMGLAEAKDWSEGVVNPSRPVAFGVMRFGQTMAEAKDILDRCHRADPDSVYEIMPNDAKHEVVTFARFGCG